MAPNNNLSTVDMSSAKLNLATGPSLAPKDTNRKLPSAYLKKGGKIAEDKFPSANRNERTTAAKSTMAPYKAEVVLPSANHTKRITANWAAEVNMAPNNNTGGNIHFRSASSMMAINNTPRQPKISVLREGWTIENSGPNTEGRNSQSTTANVAAYNNSVWRVREMTDRLRVRLKGHTSCSKVRNKLTFLSSNFIRTLLRLYCHV